GPHPRSKPREEGGAEGGRLELLRTLDPRLQNVREELAEPRVRRHAAIDAQRSEWLRAIALHCEREVECLVGNRFERGAREVCRGGIERKTAEQTARVRLPVRSTESDEGRYQVDAVVVGQSGSERGGLRGAFNRLQSIAQPFHRGARDEDRAFQRIS